MKHILIIGGMGPQASVHAHRRVLDFAYKADAQHNQDYPRITHLSVNVPDFISDTSRKAEALVQLESALAEVKMSSITSGFIACNTAHILYSDLAKIVGDNKLVSMIDITNTYISDLRTTHTCVGLLATPSTVRERLYEVDILPTEDQQTIIEDCIRRLISNEDPRSVVKRLMPVVNDYHQQGATHILVGCTELSMIAPLLRPESSIIDPIDIIAQKMVES